MTDTRVRSTRTCRGVALVVVAIAVVAHLATLPDFESIRGIAQNVVLSKLGAEGSSSQYVHVGFRGG